MSTLQLRKLLVYAMNLIAFGTLHLSGEMNAAVLVLFYAGLVLSWFWEPPRLVLERWRLPWTVATLACFAFSLADVFLWKEFFLISALNFVLFLQVSKLFQREAHKDYTQSMALSLLVMTSGAALNENLSYGVLFALFVLATTPSLVVQHLVEETDRNRLPEGRGLRLERPVLWVTLGLAALVFAGAATFFFVFPRLGFGFFAKQSRRGVATAGFGEKVELGEGGSIGDNQEIVMRVKFPTPPDQGEVATMHWRGLSLNEYDGRAWRDDHNAPREVLHFDQGYGIGSQGGWPETVAGTLAAEVYLEPMPSRVLFAPGQMSGIELTLNSADIPDSVMGRRLVADTSGQVVYEARKELGVRYLARYRPLPSGEEVATGLRWAAGVTDIAHLTAGMAALAQSPEAASLPRQREARDVAVRDYLRRWNDLAGSLPVPPPTPAGIELVRQARLHQLSLEDAAVAGTWSDSWWTLASKYAAVPEGTLSARTVALTDELRRRSPDPSDYARALERELQTRRYTLEMKQASKGENVLDSFLFDWRAGHCEYFATAMTMMLRQQGIPARIVNGFLGADYNSVGEYWAVRQNYAHSWVEAYFPGRGWVMFDPTPGGPTVQMPGESIWSTLQMGLDTARLAWFRWVVEYDFEKQASILRDAFTQTQSSQGADPGRFSDAARELFWTILRRTKATFWEAVLAVVATLLFRLRTKRRLLWAGPDWTIGTAWLLLSAGVIQMAWPAGWSAGALALGMGVPVVGTFVAYRLRRALLGSDEPEHRRSRPRRQLEVSGLYLRLLQELERRTGTLEVDLTSRGFLERSAQYPAEVVAELEAFVAVYEQARFGGVLLAPAEVSAWRRRVKKTVKAMRRAPAWEPPAPPKR